MKRRDTLFDKSIDGIYDVPYENTREELFELMRSPQFTRMRCRTIRSGEMLESEIYPVYGDRTGARAARQAMTPEKQKNQNQKNATKKLVRLVNANFTAGSDIWVHLKYDNEHRPLTIEAALKLVQNYIRRLKRYAARQGWPALKYIYITEGGGDTGKNLHHHLVINFPDRDIAEKFWPHEKHPRANRLMDDVFKFAGMATYMSKDPKGNKRFVPSRNLTKPKVTIADCKFSRSQVQRVLEGRLDAKELFEKIYKGYKYLTHTGHVSDYISGAYLYVQMRC